MSRYQLLLMFGALTAALVLAGCAGAGSANTPAASAPTSMPAASVVLAVGQNDKLGKFLTDGDGRTLYVFDKDSGTTSNCNDQCAKNWPPLVAGGLPALKDDVSSSQVGSATRKDGSKQITYNGRPLYYYAGDKKPGDTAGEGIGGSWWAMSPAGQAIKAGSSNSAAPTATPSGGGGYGGSAQSGSGKSGYVDPNY